MWWVMRTSCVLVNGCKIERRMTVQLLHEQDFLMSNRRDTVWLMIWLVPGLFGAQPTHHCIHKHIHMFPPKHTCTHTNTHTHTHTQTVRCDHSVCCTAVSSSTGPCTSHHRCTCVFVLRLSSRMSDFGDISICTYFRRGHWKKIKSNPRALSHTGGDKKSSPVRPPRETVRQRGDGGVSIWTSLSKPLSRSVHHSAVGQG